MPQHTRHLFREGGFDSEKGNGSMKSLSEDFRHACETASVRALCAQSKERTHQSCIVFDDCLVVLSRLGGFGPLDQMQDNGGSVGIAIASQEIRANSLSRRWACAPNQAPTARSTSCPLPPTPLSLLPQGWARAAAAVNSSRCGVKRLSDTRKLNLAPS